MAAGGASAYQGAATYSDAVPAAKAAGAHVRGFQ
jgi:hypothetical protein